MDRFERRSRLGAAKGGRRLKITGQAKDLMRVTLGTLQILHSGESFPIRLDYD